MEYGGDTCMEETREGFRVQKDRSTTTTPTLATTESGHSRGVGVDYVDYVD